MSQPTQRSLLLVLVAVLCATIGVWLWWQQGPDSVPMTPLVPARAITGSMAPESAELPANNPVDAVVRKQADMPSADVPSADRAKDALSAIEVVVLGANGPGANEQPLAHVAVGVSIQGTVGTPAFSRVGTTDQNGISRFTVPAGTGPAGAAPDTAPILTAWCALGGESRVVLDGSPSHRIELRMQPRCLVEGTVEDASGQGIADAEIVLVPWEDRRSYDLPGCLRIGRSRADGSFSVGLAGAAVIAALHRDFSPSATVFVAAERDRNKPARGNTVQLRLMTTQARITGLVTDAEGAPVRDAVLEFRPSGKAPGGELKAPPQRARTAPDGRFAVQNLLPGDNQWAVRAPGHGTTTGTIQLEIGETADLRISMPAPAEIHGSVRDLEGTPVAGVRVFTGSANTFESEAVTTDAEGTFQLRDLGPGPTDIRATEPRSPNTTARTASARFDLTSGEIAQWTAVLGAENRGALRGTVVDPDGRPLARWRVTAVQGSRATSHTITTEDGQFALHVQPVESVQVLVHAPNQPAMSFPSASLPAVPPKSAPLRIVVDPNARTATVRGLVQSSQGLALPATVSIWHHEMRQFARLEADQDGRFRIERVPPGRVDFYVDHTGFVRHAQQGLSIEVAADLDLGMIPLGAAAAVHGTILGPDGRAPEQLEIYILTANSRLTAEYTAGNYRIEGIPPGKQTLRIQGKGVAPVQVAIEVHPDHELVQDIQLVTGIPRRIVVHAPTEAGTFVSLALHKPGEPHEWTSSQSRTGEATVEFLAYMMPGSFEVLAKGDLGWTCTTTVTFRQGDESPIEMTLRRQ